MKMFKSWLLLAALSFASLSFAQADGGFRDVPQDPSASEFGKQYKYNSNDPGFRDVAKEFRCPTCTGLSVLESDAGFSVQIKDQVQEQLNLGKNKEQIREYFVQRYGPWILREPPKQGFNIFAWALPGLLLCFGPVLIWLRVFKQKVQVDTHGLRPTEQIIKEMQDKLQQLRTEKR